MPTTTRSRSRLPEPQVVMQVFHWSPEVHHIMLMWFAGTPSNAIGELLPIS
jgi:hypothetical protein